MITKSSFQKSTIKQKYRSIIYLEEEEEEKNVFSPFKHKAFVNIVSSTLK